MRHRYDTVYEFDLEGNLHQDLGNASMRLTFTSHFFDDDTYESHDEERSICGWGFFWFQDGKETCELKAGKVVVFNKPFHFPPMSLGPNSSTSIRATLWDEERKKVTDFESMVFLDRADSDKKLELK
jgi:hypothetical protein